MTRKYYLFAVEGKGEFPFDMLRYDRAWPRRSEDVHRLGTRQTAQRIVRMASHTEPTEGRWNSFGWAVRQE